MNGFDTDAYDKPQDALQNFKSGIYNLVVLDIKMPKMDGIKLYQEIKKLIKRLSLFHNCFRRVLHQKTSGTKESKMFYAKAYFYGPLYRSYKVGSSQLVLFSYRNIISHPQMVHSLLVQKLRSRRYQQIQV
jgi:response regulator RpfG family c-di-GMP phosphodiesterase